VFELENMTVCLTDVSAAPELIAPSPVASPEAASRFVLAVLLGDLVAACTDLAQHGVVLLSGPVDRPWGSAPPVSPTPPGMSGRSLRAGQPLHLPSEPGNCSTSAAGAGTLAALR
jgi:hypothetical protein